MTINGGTARLNRTSVGLKPLIIQRLQQSSKSLNRTSVGLKPRILSAEGPEPTRASIEPAWD